jgi:hypothetical protein
LGDARKEAEEKKESEAKSEEKKMEQNSIVCFFFSLSLFISLIGKWSLCE